MTKYLDLFMSALPGEEHYCPEYFTAIQNIKEHCPPALFEFTLPDEKAAKELWETAICLMENGAITLPYATTLFELITDQTSLIFFSLVREGGDIFTNSWTVKRDTGEVFAGIGFSVDKNPPGVQFKPAEYLFKKGLFESLNIEKVKAQTIGHFLICISMLASPMYEKRKQEAPKKIVARRLGQNKVPPTDYHKVFIRRDVQRAYDAALAAHENNPRKSPRPHWRRGHVRKLANGKICAIPALIVNLDKAIYGEPVKAEYVVK